MAKRYKRTTPAPVDLVLGWLAAGVWFVGQLAGALRLLAATLAVAVVLGLAHTAVAPARGVGSTWDPHFVVLAPGLRAEVVGP
jgi:hypothetical protein